MRRFVLPILLLLISICDSKAQLVTPFEGKGAVRNILFSDIYDYGRDKTCATIQVSEVKIWDDYVDIEYVVTATENIKNGIYLGFANNGYISIEGGILKLPVYGQLSGDQLFEVGSDHKRGWAKMEKGQKGRYILRFKGHIPNGVTKFTINPGKELFTHYSSSVFCFDLQGLINPPKSKYHSKLTSASMITENIDNNNDGICGIYELIGGGVSNKIACVKVDGEYQLIHMDRTPSLSWWSVGDIKAWLTKTPSGIYKAKWLMADKAVNEDIYITFDGYSMSLVSGIDASEQVYLKTYPSGSSTNSIGQMQIVGSGTGFAIDKRGYFVTNHHVIDGAGAIGICIQKNGEWVSYNGKVIKTDPTNDIAIIKIDDEDFKEFNNIPYSFSYESEDVAAEIFTLGYPRVDVMGTDVKYTTGVINSRTGIQGDPTHYQISAHIDHGNSGGPLFNTKGHVIGITDSGLDKAKFGDVNYSVKSMYIKALVESLPIKLQLPNDSRITNMSRSEQIKTISPYVALILIAQ
ncbi:MAG: trypsin-like peptidase domain-containing protein [Bacteroidales bacterium]|nr:trypsin-like peptidase domain-containing protein [Candidatus Colimorpha pelethequi]